MRTVEGLQLFMRGYFAGGGRSRHTQKAYECDLKQFVAHVGDDTSLGDIDVGSLENWASALRDAEYSPASRRRKFASVRCFFRFLVRRGVLAESPFSTFTLRLPRPSQMPKALTTLEARALLTVARRTVTGQSSKRFLAHRNRAIIEILLFTGLRVGELVALDTMSVRPLESSLFVRGKGGRERIALLVDEECRNAVGAYDELRRTMSPETKTWLLNARGHALSTQGVAHVLKGLSRQAGIKRRVTPHMLRHTAATLLLHRGVDVRVVQEFLGHASIVTTQRYTHVTRQHLRETLEKRYRSDAFGL